MLSQVKLDKVRESPRGICERKRSRLKSYMAITYTWVLVRRQLSSLTQELLMVLALCDDSLLHSTGSVLPAGIGVS